MKINVLTKIIESVPPELKEQFNALQLKNSIDRIKILALVGLFFKILDIFVLKAAIYDQLWSIRDSIELVLIAASCFFYFPIIKKIKTNILWTICILCVVILYIVYTYDFYLMPTGAYVPFMVFILAFLFTMFPDFKPNVFILIVSFYLFAIVFILSYKYKFIDGYFSSIKEYSFILCQCIVFILLVLITKVLLYNSKIKNYVNTYNINSLNNELQNYSHNLEKMVDKRTATIVELKNAIMETIADLVERRDETTGGHVSRTSRYLKIVISAMVKQGLYSDQTETWNIDQMVLSAQLHDVGKIAINDNILRKPAKLDEDEFEQMKRHTIFGGEIIKEIQEKTSESEFLNYAYTFAVYHHEKWDGSGYPYGIAGENIPLSARLMAIIDVYDALVSERPYKKAFTHEESVKIIGDGKGSHFDPYLVEVFLSASEQFVGVKK